VLEVHLSNMPHHTAMLGQAMAPDWGSFTHFLASLAGKDVARYLL
jgi:hypothetical protein